MGLVAGVISHESNSLDTRVDYFNEDFLNFINKENQNYHLSISDNSDNELDSIGKSNFEKSVEKALDLYKKIHLNEVPELDSAMNFLNNIKFLFSSIPQEIVFKSDSVRVLAAYRGKDFIIDYDYGFEDSIFITNKTETGYIVKECTIETVKLKMESYFDLSERITTAA